MAGLAGAQTLRCPEGQFSSPCKARGSRVCRRLPSQLAGTQPLPPRMRDERCRITYGCCPTEASREVPRWTLP